MSSELSQQYNINILERPEENFLMLCEICFVKYQISLFYFVYLTGRVRPPPPVYGTSPWTKDSSYSILTQIRVSENY